MKKQDIVILAVLFALWIAWPTVDRQLKKRFFKTAPATVAEQTVQAEEPAQAPAAPAEPSAPAAEPVAPLTGPELESQARTRLQRQPDDP